MSKKSTNLADLIVMHADVLAKFIEAGFPITIGGTITLLPSVEKSPETIKVETQAEPERPVPTSDDPAAPFGRDRQARAIAPYGLKADGNPKRSAAGRPAASAPVVTEAAAEEDTDALEVDGDEMELSLDDEDEAPPAPVKAAPEQPAKPGRFENVPLQRSVSKPAPVKSKPAADPFADLLGDL